MDGILLVDKPKGYTSHDVVNVLRKAYHTKKVGHTGTLDPDATGLLVVGLNKGTKIMTYLNQDDKEYIATICFGTTTDTLDATGEIIATSPLTDLSRIDDVLQSFQGEYVQTPPMYSAVKYQGKRLYEYAREGIDIPDRPSRTITIHTIERIGDVIVNGDRAYVTYRVHASKGLYVRVLSYDIGQRFGMAAHNHDLIRTQAGSFHLDDAISLDDMIATTPDPIPMAEALAELHPVIATPKQIEDIRHGRPIDLAAYPDVPPGLTKFLDGDGRLIAIYDKDPEKRLLKAKNVFL